METCEYFENVLKEYWKLNSADKNALLKTIEEPPHYTIFMFCTTNPEKISANNYHKSSTV